MVVGYSKGIVVIYNLKQQEIACIVTDVHKQKGAEALNQILGLAANNVAAERAKNADESQDKKVKT